MSTAQPTAAEPARRRSPYADAPRLPAGEALGKAEILGAAAAAAPSSFELEIGPGRGHFIVERAAQSTDICIIGLEIRLKWASLVDERLRSLGFGARARVFAEDMRHALPRLASSSFDKLFIHFPDPWWKKRHAKRRLASGPVVDQLARLACDGAELFVQTDVWETAEAYREAIESHSAFVPAGDEPGSARREHNPYGARSPRERRVMADGLPVFRLCYRRTAREAR